MGWPIAERGKDLEKEQKDLEQLAKKLAEEKK